MPGKISLYLLILSGIWSHGIIEAFADEKIKESSDFLVRHKRVVSYMPGEDVQVRITDAPHVVRIKELGRTKCVGSILSINVVITSTMCASMDPGHYEIVANSAYTHHGIFHNVRDVRRRIDNSQGRFSDGVALLIVAEQFVYSQSLQPIRLHTGPVLIGSFGKFHGWGYNFRNANNRGTNFPKHLRSIDVPVISHQDCVNIYRPHLLISERTVCTYHPQRHSGHLDFGSGLIVDGGLAGVFLWSGVFGQTDPRLPDVFAYLHDPYYNQWVRTNVQNIDASL